MLMCIYRSVLVFICIGLLAFHPQEVCGLRSAGLLLRRGVDDQPLTIKNHRTLKAAETNSLTTDKKQTPLNKTFDPNQSSKRKVRRGSDPIHNRTWHKQGISEKLHESRENWHWKRDTTMCSNNLSGGTYLLAKVSMWFVEWLSTSVLEFGCRALCIV